MTALTKPRMNVDEFLAWAVDQPGRFELFRGEVYAMSPETVGHAKVKGAVYAALLAAVRKSGRPCHVLPDGATVRVDDATAYEPDALVYCGQELAASAIEVPEPVVVAEVIPSSRQVDLGIKPAGYFLLPRWRHRPRPTRAETGPGGRLRWLNCQTDHPQRWCTKGTGGKNL